MSRVSAEERRRQLADAAVAILIEKGPQGLTTRAVAQQAGAPLGTVHYAFAGKDELLTAAVSQILASFAQALREGVDPRRGLRAAIDAMLRGYWAWLVATPGLGTAVLETFVAGLRTSGTAEMIAAAERFVVDILEEAAAHDPEAPRTPVDELARLTLVAADGLMLVHGADAGGAAAAADLDRVVVMLTSLV